jgi:serine/threonine protein kinase
MLTQEGVVMGTPDYIAPEQAREARSVDIRADLYSLGCTFYFLLTGSAPFPKGSLVQKLAKHQFEDPTPVESLRPEVPRHVSAIIRKLMAKAPADRYQSPAELIEALGVAGVPNEPGPSPASVTEAVASAVLATPKVPVPGQERTASDTAALWSSVVTPPIVTLPQCAAPTRRLEQQPPWLWIGVAAGAVLLLVVLGLLLARI